MRATSAWCLLMSISNGEDAMQKARLLRPNVILVDLVMPRKNGTETIVAIQRENPGARFLVLTRFDEDDKVFPAIEAGAQDYLLKDPSFSELLQGIRDVHSGASAVQPSIARRLNAEHSQASDLWRMEDSLTNVNWKC